MDHTITLTDRQEKYAQMIVDAINTGPGDMKGTETVDSWMKGMIIHPIRAKITEMKAIEGQSVLDAYSDATATVQADVKKLLGI